MTAQTRWLQRVCRWWWNRLVPSQDLRSVILSPPPPRPPRRRITVVVWVHAWVSQVPFPFPFSFPLFYRPLPPSPTPASRVWVLHVCSVLGQDPMWSGPVFGDLPGFDRHADAALSLAKRVFSRRGAVRALLASRCDGGAGDVAGIAAVPSAPAPSGSSGCVPVFALQVDVHADRVPRGSKCTFHGCVITWSTASNHLLHRFGHNG